jgi:2-polyprenyl-6-methoxyphenol hydroxylase-like FAD-dependent oxidoreductase
MRIAINGAGIAGPTLAYWLRSLGHEVLLIEQAPALRTGGYIIDFWGAGYDVAEKMGLLPRIRALGYQVREVRFVDQRGRRTGGFSTGVFDRMTNGRFTSLRRSDVSASIYGALHGAVDTLFGDSITEIEERPGSVRLRFTRAAPRDVDLIVGADGLHSRVRQIVFGPQSEFEVPLGYHVAAFEIAGYRPHDELVYVSHAVPGKQISRFAMRDDKTLFLFVFRDEYLAGRHVADPNDQRSALADVFADVGWECPQILAAMANVGDIYFDRVSQIRMSHWTKDRCALVGDAAACVSLLAGEGTGLAMVAAYVLAGALHACHGNHHEAFARYENCVMPWLRRKQESAARFASSFVPSTVFGIAFRNVVTRLLRIPAVADLVIGRELRDDFDIPAELDIDRLSRGQNRSRGIA